jgi:hypothetical protein
MRIGVQAGIIGLIGAGIAAAACGGTSPSGFALSGDGGSTSSSGSGSSSSTSSGGSGASSSGSFGDGGAAGSSSGGNGPTLIYAHTDTELYSMDPTSHVLTDIGPFSDGSGMTPTITDLAVDGEGNVWVNSESAVYKAAVPTGTGTVDITVSTQLGTTTSFYALGFTPAGTLESGESLIAGDSKGDLYYIDQSGAAAPQDLGGFGPAPSGGTYELSGDVVFYSLNGSPRGLATVRACKSSSSCTETDDVLVEVNISALQQAYTSKTPSTSLLQQALGSGTSYGRLFGVGAWGSSVYAFSRASGSSSEAQLIQIDASGNGTSLQSFPAITSGWSGAGVTTKAQVTVLQ